jgi:enoyl-CoA hydratase/carnithine racemase
MSPLVVVGSTVVKSAILWRRYSLIRHSSSLVSYTVENDDNDNKVGILTLNSPKTYNALTMEMGREFKALITEVEHDLQSSSNVQAIVLQGAGDQAFSAGGNLEWLQSLSHNSVHANMDLMLQFYNSFLGMRQRLPVPVIAALQGPAMGAGACLALACDLRVAASDNTRVLGFPFSKLGIPSGMGGLYMLQQSGLSTAQATEILLLGKTLTGEEANDLGLVNRLVPKEQVKTEARNLAKEIAQQHPVAVRSMIRSLRLGTDGGLQDALYRDAHAQAMCYNRQDWGRGLQAVAEKRPAEFDEYHSK